MSEPKTQCRDCGAAILQRTADGYDGRCVPCHGKATAIPAAIPPQGFELPRELAGRVAALNEDPAAFRQMAWREGADFVRGFLDKIEECNRLFEEWSPRLRAFAEKCREDRPPPAHDSPSISDRAKQRIYEAKLERPLLGRQSTVAICCMPLIAIPVAERLWPSDARIVLLTPEEEARWNEIYVHPEGSLHWVARFWWIIDDSPEREFPWDVAVNDVPPGESPWLLNVGHRHGPLAGAGNSELWAWDGRRAKFIRTVSVWIS